MTRLPDFESPIVYTYSLESTIAEKFDAILQRMSGTSRMKDFYDIYYLSGIFDFDGAVLKQAIGGTLAHRGRELRSDVFGEIGDFKSSEFLNRQWDAFEPARNTGLGFEEALFRLNEFLKPVYDSILTDTAWGCLWSCASKAWLPEKHV